MTATAHQTGDGGAIFLYDGDCAFCSACARFILRRVPTAASVRPWQSVDIAALGLRATECDEAVQWVAVDQSGRRHRASDVAAIAALLRGSRWFWRVPGWLLGTRVVLSVARPVYRWVARHRDRMPGGTAACALPQAQRAHTRGTGPVGLGRV